MDLRQIIPPEPDSPDATNLKIKFKFPDGKQLTRSFLPSCSVKVRMQSRFYCQQALQLLPIGIARFCWIRS